MIIHAKAAVAERNGSFTIGDIELHPPQEGEGVKNVKTGDKVLLNRAIPCRACYQCQTGHQNICEKNSPVTGSNPDNGTTHVGSAAWRGWPLKRSFNIGTLSPHTVVNQKALIPYEVKIPFESACLIGCGVDDPLIEGNRKLHVQLQEAGIDCSYQEFPGGHEWPYWIEHIAETFRFFDRA